ncbi:unnamed protein product (macronuclear) [Paramecium tetraurelia]|uniref:Uncharacterized protein n=1 Tax=Paramecium tetraurelia TaxID=5888 RepID=A0DUE4_PARTE|nr:uncharacterized protein GSPATT00020333001 [Paramecium tetraurelia]CAK86661.1 unnamed protein product [Paramecium tetraurelia]|eukprot:XP_001454058.1 hypothetical protein (macronuclear) [Paramecium tetraurelia strain d4-2]
MSDRKQQLEKKEKDYHQSLLMEKQVLDEFHKPYDIMRKPQLDTMNEGSLSEKVKQYFQNLNVIKQTNMVLIQIRL